MWNSNQPALDTIAEQEREIRQLRAALKRSMRRCKDCPGYCACGVPYQMESRE